MIKDRRERRKLRIRRKISGTQEFPRLSVYKSLRSLYAQVIDDTSSKTLCGGVIRGKKNQGAAGELADQIAVKLKEHKIAKVKFDRNGYRYGATLSTFVDTLRKNQIEV